MRLFRLAELSRLKVAWGALAALAMLFAVAVLLVPTPSVRPDAVIDLPREPDRFAVAVTPGEATPGMMGAWPGTWEGEAGEAALSAETAAMPAPTASGGMVSDEWPVETVTETLPGGAVRITLPSVSETESASTAFETFRRPAPARAPDGRPAVGVLVSGLGLDTPLSERAIAALPPEVSLGFAPYARDLGRLAETARKAGHELVLEIPMEGPQTLNGTLGPAGLTLDRGAEANGERLDWLLSRLPSAAMATNYLGGAFSQDPLAIARVLAQLDGAGLGYVEDTGLAARPAADLSMPYAEISVTVPAESGAVEEGLARLESAARRDGHAVAKVYVTQETVEGVARWAAGVEERGLQLVPVSAAADETR